VIAHSRPGDVDVPSPLQSLPKHEALVRRPALLGFPRTSRSWGFQQVMSVVSLEPGRRELVGLRSLPPRPCRSRSGLAPKAVVDVSSRFSPRPLVLPRLAAMRDDDPLCSSSSPELSPRALTASPRSPLLGFGPMPSHDGHERCRPSVGYRVRPLLECLSRNIRVEEMPSLRSRSDLVVSHHLAGLLRTRGAGSRPAADPGVRLVSLDLTTG
jgi:hypothetical protein